MRKNIVSLLVCLLFFVFVGSTVAQSSKPNIVVYLADDLGYYDVSVYGAKVVKTPVIEKLSNEGMTFNNAFVASPTCAPSRGALLTGLMPARNGAELNQTHPSPEIRSLIENLKDAGYKVLAFGKVGHGRKGNEQAGFDFQDPDKVNFFFTIQQYFDTASIETPVCIFVGDRRPHTPWTEKMIYDPSSVDLPYYYIDTPLTREHRAKYYSDVTGFDYEMGQVLHYLGQKLGDNLLTLFTSDHGALWPYGKRNLYDEGIRTPMIVKWPGVIAPKVRTDAMVSWVDVLPTLVDMVGGGVPSDIDGRSFKSILLGDGLQTFRDTIYATHSGDNWHNKYPIRSIRTTRYKLIRNTFPEAYCTSKLDMLERPNTSEYWKIWKELAKSDPKAAYVINRYHVRPALELYDLSVDPYEQMNFADNPAYAGVLSNMEAQLNRWMRQQGDDGNLEVKPFLLSEPLPDPKTLTNPKKLPKK